MEDRLHELIAFSNKLDIFFDTLLEEAASLYPEGSLLKRAVLVHSSLSAFGKSGTQGGPETVLAALLRACRKKGMTVVMCAHSDYTADETGGAPEPLVFNRRKTPCCRMGAIAEAFRNRHGTKRSGHPYLSFCALGPAAGKLTRGHRFETGLGMKSPLGTLHRMDALILMLGTGYETCTALHLAEYAEADRVRAEGEKPETVTCHAGIVRSFGGGIAWKCREDIAFHPERFPEVGRAFETVFPEKIRTGALGNGTWRLVRLRDLTGFSIDRYGVLE